MEETVLLEFATTHTELIVPKMSNPPTDTLTESQKNSFTVSPLFIFYSFDFQRVVSLVQQPLMHNKLLNSLTLARARLGLLGMLSTVIGIGNAFIKLLNFMIAQMVLFGSEKIGVLQMVAIIPGEIQVFV